MKKIRVAIVVEVPIQTLLDDGGTEVEVRQDLEEWGSTLAADAPKGTTATMKVEDIEA